MRKLLVALALVSASTVLGLAARQPPSRKVWIFFQERGLGAFDSRSLEEAESRLAPRALARRALRGRASLTADVQVDPRHLAELRRAGIEPLSESRWLNAVTAELTREQVALLRSAPYVRAVRPVARAHRAPPHVLDAPPGRFGWVSESGLDYGLSSNQNLLVNVPAVHELGLHGEGVVIGMLDSGFRYHQHEAFAEIRVIAERDFIHGDDSTENEPEKGDIPSQDSHGTETLAVAGGYRPGKLVGPAFRATFALAKTEWVPDETHVEEDNWVAGLEWLESMGADVVSSSLGYFSGFSDGNDYSFGDLDGRTAITSRAAEMAAARGVVVVNSAGNSGAPLTPGVGTLGTPADSAFVVAVGALFPSGTLASFSSRGPTADGRIKPDVMAQGAAVATVAPSTSDAYLYLNGTSFSCPQVAAVAALVLQAHPRLTPEGVLEALRTTADRAASPDNDFGWGTVDALGAVFYHGAPVREGSEPDR